MPLELEIDVPENRQVTLPDSVPVGKVKLTVQTPFDPFSPLPHTSDKFERERAAFFRLLPELLKSHPGKVVAIHDEQVIAVGDERRPVIDEARRIAGDVDLYVESVLTEWPVERIGTRRVVGRRIA
jgi:hypothetical protein